MDVEEALRRAEDPADMPSVMEAVLAAEVRKLRAAGREVLAELDSPLSVELGDRLTAETVAAFRAAVGMVPVATPLVVLLEPEGAYRCNVDGCSWIRDPYEHAAAVHGITDRGDVNVVHPDDH